MKSHKFPFTIAFADTDAAGIVYHARFIEIAERARMDWFKKEMLIHSDGGFIIKKLSAKYDIPLTLMDEIVVESCATHVGAASADIEQKFLRNGTVCAIVNIRVAYVGIKDLKPKRIPAEWLKHF
ncbi:MAG: thioesterase family protein [Alphaproteobacteria bacterium]|nr:thioesterase family protein [Alphaproteobacteria bacterium]